VFKRSKPQRGIRLNIIQLIDIILILLIFFVVTTTFSKLPGLKVNLPATKTANQLPPNNLIIGVTKDGEYYIEKNKFSLAELAEVLKNKAQQSTSLNVVIMADQETQLKNAVNVMDLARLAGISNFSIAQEIGQ